MFARIGTWLKGIEWSRVCRTFVQVFGPVLVLFLYDFGADGQVVVRDYIFGNEGIIVVGTSALAILMNLPPRQSD
jgi:hypothetical protein